MTLGLFLSIGESFEDLAKTGQDYRFKSLYLSKYAQKFSKVYVFSYKKDDQTTDLPKNVVIISNKYNLNRFLYGVVMPFVNFKVFRECDVLRAYHVYGSIPAIVASFVFNKKFIFNYAYDYEYVAKVSQKRLQVFVTPYLTMLAAKFSSGILLAANYLKYKIPKNYQNKIIYSPNGVDTGQFKPNSHNGNKGPLKAIFVGRLEKEKNLENLFKALGKSQIELTVVGEGSQKEELKRLSKKTTSRVNFIGKISNDKLPSYYQKSDLFFLTSLSEGSPKSLIEAQASGLCCIVSDIPANREIVKDGYNGILSETTKEGIAESIKKVEANYNLIEKMSKNARQSAVEKFGIQKILDLEIKVLIGIAKSIK